MTHWINIWFKDSEVWRLPCFLSPSLLGCMTVASDNERHQVDSTRN